MSATLAREQLTARSVNDIKMAEEEDERGCSLGEPALFAGDLQNDISVVKTTYLPLMPPSTIVRRNKLRGGTDDVTMV